MATTTVRPTRRLAAGRHGEVLRGTAADWEMLNSRGPPPRLIASILRGGESKASSSFRTAKAAREFLRLPARSVAKANPAFPLGIREQVFLHRLGHDVDEDASEGFECGFGRFRKEYLHSLCGHGGLWRVADKVVETLLECLS